MTCTCGAVLVRVVAFGESPGGFASFFGEPPRLTAHHRPPERLELPRDVAMASIAIASLGHRRVLMDLTTVLFPAVEDDVADSSSDPILDVGVRSGLGR